MICSGPDCLRRAVKGGLCWGCLKARQRRAVDDPDRPLTPRERMMEAILAVADASDDDTEWRRVWREFNRVGRVYFSLHRRAFVLSGTSGGQSPRKFRP